MKNETSTGLFPQRLREFIDDVSTADGDTPPSGAEARDARYDLKEITAPGALLTALEGWRDDLERLDQYYRTVPSQPGGRLAWESQVLPSLASVITELYLLFKTWHHTVTDSTPEDLLADVLAESGAPMTPVNPVDGVPSQTDPVADLLVSIDRQAQQREITVQWHPEGPYTYEEFVAANTGAAHAPPVLVADLYEALQRRNQLLGLFRSTDIEAELRSAFQEPLYHGITAHFDPEGQYSFDEFDQAMCDDDDAPPELVADLQEAEHRRRGLVKLLQDEDLRDMFTFMEANPTKWVPKDRFIGGQSWRWHAKVTLGNHYGLVEFRDTKPHTPVFTTRGEAVADALAALLDAEVVTEAATTTGRDPAEEALLLLYDYLGFSMLNDH